MSRDSGESVTSWGSYDENVVTSWDGNGNIGEDIGCDRVSDDGMVE